METEKIQVAHPWWQPGVFASAPAIFGGTSRVTPM